MNLVEKQKVVEDLHQEWSKAKAGLVASYRGLTVSEMSDLRGRLRGGEATMRVVKNTLAKRAIVDTEFAAMEAFLSGPIAVAHGDDPVALAKSMHEFSKEHEALEIRGGVLEGKLIGISEIKALAVLPSREVLLAKLLSSMNSPISGFVRTLNEIPASFVRVLAAVRDQKETA